LNFTFINVLKYSETSLNAQFVENQV